MRSKLWATLEKKNHTYYEQEPEKVALFLKNFNSLKHLAPVYIDETGIDRYLYRPYAGAPRGEKVYEKISGRRFERTNEVEQKLNGSFLIRYIDSQIRE